MKQHKHRHKSHHHDAKAQVAKQQEPAVEAQTQVQTAPPAASFSELTNQPQSEVAEGEGADQKPISFDAVIEQLSHGMVDKELDEADEKFLEANGYEAMPIIRGVHEFVMRSFLPTQAGKPPMVAFRGTVPTKIQTVVADLDPTGIGMYQFNPNRALIQGQVAAAAAHGQIISTGHSLGGALAQIAGATFPDSVQRIVTFQAPGVSREMAQKLVEYNEANPDKAIESTHHRVSGDLVPYGGEALTPGTIHNHEMTGGRFYQRNALSKHTSMPLAQEEIAKGNNVPIHGDLGSHETGTVSTETDNQEKTQVIEKARTGLGYLTYGAGAVVNGAVDLAKKAASVFTD